MILKYTILLLIHLLATGCTKNKTQQKPIDVSKIEWKFDTKKDDYLIPHTKLYLMIAEKVFLVDSGLNVTNIEKKDWETFRIPKDALIACGGWWAGGGSYFYVKKEKTNLNIYKGFADEGLSLDESYKYKSIKTILLTELE